MSTEDALLAAVRAAPNDDLPRLVYADWLEENGDPDRGEFIRLQIAAERISPHAPERAAAVERAQQLMDANYERWEVPLLGLLGPHSFLPPFFRGFVEDLNLCGYDQWTAAGLPDFFRSPLVAVTTLNVFADHGNPLHAPDLVFDMLDHPALEHLQALHVMELAVHSGAMAMIASHPRLTRLDSLNFFQCDLTDFVVRELADTLSLPRLRALELRNSRFGDADVSALARSPRLAGLTTLALAGNPTLTDASARALADSPHLRQLVWLDLRGCTGLTDAGRKALRASFFYRVEL